MALSKRQAGGILKALASAGQQYLLTSERERERKKEEQRYQDELASKRRASDIRLREKQLDIEGEQVEKRQAAALYDKRLAEEREYNLGRERSRRDFEMTQSAIEDEVKSKAEAAKDTREHKEEITDKMAGADYRYDQWIQGTYEPKTQRERELFEAKLAEGKRPRGEGKSDHPLTRTELWKIWKTQDTLADKEKQPFAEFVKDYQDATAQPNSTGPQGPPMPPMFDVVKTGTYIDSYNANAMGFAQPQIGAGAGQLGTSVAPNPAFNPPQGPYAPPGFQPQTNAVAPYQLGRSAFGPDSGLTETQAYVLDIARRWNGNPKSVTAEELEILKQAFGQ